MTQNFTTECSLNSSLACLRWLTSSVRRFLIAKPIVRKILLICLGLWCAALLLMMLRGRWRWLVKCILETILLLPVGWFVTLWTGLFVLIDPVDSDSPREALQDFVSSDSAQMGIWISVLILTAFTILGGALLFAVLAVCYAIFLRLLPGYDHGMSLHLPGLGALGSATSSGSYLSSGSDDSDDSDDGGGDDSGDDDDDDGDRGSVWDGWLFKW